MPRNPDTDTRLRDLWPQTEPRLSVKTMSGILGISTSAIGRRVAALGLPRRESPMHAASSTRQQSGVDFAEIHAMRDRGLPWNEIGATIRKADPVIRQWYHAECKRRNIAPVQIAKKARYGAYALTVPTVPKPPRAMPAIVAGGVPYEGMTVRACQWMLNDRWPWRACGEPGWPWCEVHHQAAFGRPYADAAD